MFIFRTWLKAQAGDPWPKFMRHWQMVCIHLPICMCSLFGENDSCLEGCHESF